MEQILSIMHGLGVLGALVALLGRSWNALKDVLGRLGSLLGRFWAVLRRSWVVLGRSWDPLGRILGRLGGTLGYISKKCEVRPVFWSHFGTQNGSQNH